MPIELHDNEPFDITFQVFVVQLNYKDLRDLIAISAVKLSISKNLKLRVSCYIMKFKRKFSHLIFLLIKKLKKNRNINYHSQISKKNQRRKFSKTSFFLKCIRFSLLIFLDLNIYNQIILFKI